MTSTSGNLNSIRSYLGNEKNLVGNGAIIPITKTENTSLNTDTHSFDLKNVLVVPSVKKKLLSVHQFCHDNNCSFEFNSNGFSLKDKRTKRELFRCNSPGSFLYSFSPHTSSSVVHNKKIALLNSTTDFELWHRHLGHPNSNICLSFFRAMI
jgi:hypothetical protein